MKISIHKKNLIIDIFFKAIKNFDVHKTLNFLTMLPILIYNNYVRILNRVRKLFYCIFVLFYVIRYTIFLPFK